MPKCVKCEKMLPPQFCKQLEDHLDDPKALECIYCKKKVDSIDLRTGEKYTKEKCIKEYEIFLKKLAEKRNIAGAMREEESLIIKP